MAMLTIEGEYNNGKVQLSEKPKVVGGPVPVLVTFLTGRVMASSHDTDREELRRRAFMRMKEGIRIGGPPYPSREELHDRRG
jgi:hypothetical protein